MRHPRARASPSPPSPPLLRFSLPPFSAPSPRYDFPKATRFAAVRARVQGLLADAAGRPLLSRDAAGAFVGPLADLKAGFRQVAGALHAARLLRPWQVEALLEGDPIVDVAPLRARAVYSDGYTASSPQVQWLWAHLAALDNAARSRFLAYVTASPRIPAGVVEIRISKMAFTEAGQPAANKLPEAHTCSKSLDMPEYATAAILASKIDVALAYGEDAGFAIA